MGRTKTILHPEDKVCRCLFCIILSSAPALLDGKLARCTSCTHELHPQTPPPLRVEASARHPARGAGAWAAEVLLSELTLARSRPSLPFSLTVTLHLHKHVGKRLSDPGAHSPLQGF